MPLDRSGFSTIRCFRGAWKTTEVRGGFTPIDARLLLSGSSGGEVSPAAGIRWSLCGLHLENRGQVRI
jgi:hypothetical protein